jgi:hypothetical protein
MISAEAPDCSGLNVSLAKAFVEFVPEEILAVPDKVVQVPIIVPPWQEWVMGVTRPAAHAACVGYVQAPMLGEFHHADEPSWYFLASGDHYTYDSMGAPTRLLDPATDGFGMVVDANTISFPTAIPEGMTPATIVIWQNLAEYNARGEKYIAFDCHLDPNDPSRTKILSITDPNQQLLELPYYQPVEDKSTIIPQNLFALGFGIGERVVAEVLSAGAIVTSGLSPSEPTSGKFWGRTIVFLEADPSNAPHELVHGLGMAHLCGHWDFTGNDPCLMHYGHVWLLNPDGSLDRWVRKEPGLLLCPKHIVAIRNAHLEAEGTSRRLDW